MPQDDEAPDTTGASEGDSKAQGNDDDPGNDLDDLISVAPWELTLEEEFRRRRLLDAAAHYAQKGWRVIPLCWVAADGESCGYSGHNRKGDRCASPGKRALLDDWPNRATNDPVKAANWWRKVEPGTADIDEWYPWASIGVVLGQGSDIFAIDIDPEHGGFEKLEQLERENGALPPTRVHGTGSGGNHYLFRWPGFRVYNLKPWGADAGVDIKGDNGYIVMPPSISHKGEYTVSPQMVDAPIPHAPEWILEKLRRERAEQRGEQIITADALPNRLIARYVEKAMKGEHWQLANCPKGARNDQLFKSAASLGSLAAHGFVSEGEAIALLIDAGNRCGLVQSDGMGQFMASFHSGWNTGMRSPRDLSGVGNLAEHGWPRLPHNEFALGDRLVIYFGDRLRWVDDWDAWMSYTSGIWERRKMTEAERYAERMIRLLSTTEAPLYSEEPEPGIRDDELSPRERFMTWLEKQKTHSKKVNVAKIARDSPVIRAVPHQFDNEPNLMNVANGVVDLITGKLSDHNPDLMLTMRSPVAYDPDRDCPGWLQFLERVQPDPEMRAYLQRVAGYSCTGQMIEQVFFLHHGSGANGKSVFHDVMGRVLGAYSQTVPVESLMDSTMDRVPNDIARMVGRRYLIASETKMGKFLDEPKLKLLTGGDAVAARFMRGEFFEFRPVGKVHLTTNHLPRLSDDSATWRRIHMIPWPVSIPERERDGFLAERLFRDEGPGILNWIVQGALSWRHGPARVRPEAIGSSGEQLAIATPSRGTELALAVEAAFEEMPEEMAAHRTVVGLRAPAMAKMFKEDYRKAEDEHQQFLDECCDIDMERTARTTNSTSKTLLAHYNDWAHENGYQHDKQRYFTEIMKKKGYQYVNTGSFRGFPQITPKAGI